MDDMNNLKDFLCSKVDMSSGYGVSDFSVDELKELRYLATLAMVQLLVGQHGKIMKDILKDIEK